MEKLQCQYLMINFEKDSLARHVTAIAEAAENMKANHLGSPAFEIGTVLAFLYLKEKNCDIVTLETGMGGALDATNVIRTPVLEVIASSSMDPMDGLGDTLKKIAHEKAGVIKSYTKAASAAQNPEADGVVAETCEKNGCSCRSVDPARITDVCHGYEMQTFSYRTWSNVKISLAESYQILNVALALEAVEALRKLGYRLSDAQVYQGFLNTHWRGRFTLLQKDPAVIIDGAHNQGAAQELRRSLALYFPGKKLHYIMGMFKVKDYDKVIELNAPLAEHIITVETPSDPRALPTHALKEAVSKVNPSVEAAGSIAEAVKKALEQAKKKDALIIFGSLSFLGEAEKAVHKGGNNHG